ALREPVFARAHDGQPVRAEGGGGGDSCRHRQRHRLAAGRRDSRRDRGRRLHLPAARVPRRVRPGVPGGDSAVQACRTVCRSEMKYWIPVFGLLLLLPLGIKSDVVLTILVFSWLQGMLAVSFNLIFGFTGQLSMFHAAAFGVAAYATHIIMQQLGVSYW